MQIYPTKFLKDVSPIRSIKLAPIEPIFMSEDRIESLSSYVIRLATAHWVSPTQLLISLRKEFTKTDNSSLRVCPAFDVHSQATTDLLNCLPLASTIDFDFSNLTLRAWHDTYTKEKGHGLTNKWLRWCNACHLESEGAQAPLYNKLVWNLGPNEVCVRHACRLSEECPSCSSKQRYLTCNSFIGICHYCGSKLYDDSISLVEASEKQLWISKACSDLIRNTRNGISFRSSDLMSSLEEIISIHFSGKTKTMSMELDMEDTIRSWVRGRSPIFSGLMKLCYQIQIHPAELFSRNRSIIDIQRKYDIERIYKYRPYISKRECNLVSRKLDNILSSNKEIISLEDIARQLGISRQVLRRRFPTQSDAIIEKVKQRRKLEYLNKNIERVTRIEERARILVENNIYPGERQLLKDPLILPSDLRIAFVKKALKKIKAKAKFDLNLA